MHLHPDRQRLGRQSSCASGFGCADKLTGKIEDTKVAWKTGGGSVTPTFRGTLSKTAENTGSITGSVTVEEYGVEGEFTATRSN